MRASVLLFIPLVACSGPGATGGAPGLAVESLSPPAVDPDQPVTAGGIGSFSETSVAVARAREEDCGDRAPCAASVVGFNVDMLAVGWAFRRDLESGDGWEYHSSLGAERAWDPPSDRPGDGGEFDRYLGDPSVVATGAAGQFAFFSIVASTTGGTDIGVTVSNDGGATFAGGEPLVSRGGATDADEPDAVTDAADTDATHPGAIYVWWRSSATGASWVRKLRVDAAGAVTLQALRPVPVAGVASARLAVGYPRGVRTLWLVYPEGSLPERGDCSSDLTTTVRFLDIASTDEGATWSSPEVIATDGAYKQCVTWARNHAGANRLRPSVVYDAATESVAAAFPGSDSARPAPAPGMLIHVYARAPGSPWTLRYVAWPFGAGEAEYPVDEFGQSMAAARGRVLLAWHTTAFDPAHANLRVGMQAAMVTLGDPPGCSAPVPVSNTASSAAPVSWLQDDGAPNTDWGDYEGMAAVPGDGTFVVAWGDNRVSAEHTSVFATRVRPPAGP